MLLHAAKCQGYNFYRFLVIKGKPAGGITPRLGLIDGCILFKHVLKFSKFNFNGQKIKTSI